MASVIVTEKELEPKLKKTDNIQEIAMAEVMDIEQKEGETDKKKGAPEEKRNIVNVMSKLKTKLLITTQDCEEVITDVKYVAKCEINSSQSQCEIQSDDVTNGSKIKVVKNDTKASVSEIMTFKSMINSSESLIKSVKCEMKTPKIEIKTSEKPIMISSDDKDDEEKMIDDIGQLYLCVEEPTEEELQNYAFELLHNFFDQNPALLSELMRRKMLQLRRFLAWAAASRPTSESAESVILLPKLRKNWTPTSQFMSRWTGLLGATNAPWCFLIKGI